METGTLTMHGGIKVDYIKNLKVGDKVLSIATFTATGYVGYSNQTYGYEAFEVGREYPVSRVNDFDGHKVAYAIDDDGELQMVTAELFKLPDPVLP